MAAQWTPPTSGRQPVVLDRLTAAVAAVKDDIAVGAGQINFDFSMVKHEAPPEYRLLGENISGKRRIDAERGFIHIIARRLGALFEGACPQTPNLIRIYGIRASEISETARGFFPPEDAGSIFADHAGIDGTSIWAAATSCVPAIQMHLLACMLAKIWDAPEAVSIWVEIVKERRNEVAGRFDSHEEVQFSHLVAATQAEITRSQLADWDSSARAWLRAAGLVKCREYKQLILALDKLRIAMNDEPRVYPSVMTVWKTALMTMENLVCGAPQVVEEGDEGATLLGIASWHLYPDMVLLTSDRLELRMQDHLVSPRAVLTVGPGRQSAQNQDSRQGISWNLALAWLRYYGSPLVATGELSFSTTRVDFDQFGIAAFGALLRSWEVSKSKIPILVDFFLAIAAAFRRSEARYTKGSARYDFLRPDHWFHMMADGADVYSKAVDEEKNTIWKLIMFGQRRAQVFLKNTDLESDPVMDIQMVPNTCPRLFGLKDPRILIPSLRDETDRLTYLRRVALRLDTRIHEDLLIRYRTPGGLLHYATAVPWEHEGPSNNPFFKDDSSHKSHERWLQRASKGDQLPILPGENCRWQMQNEFVNDTELFVFRRPGTNQYCRYGLLFGDPELAAIFILDETEVQSIHHPLLRKPKVKSKDLLWCLELDMFSMSGKRKSLITTVESSTTYALEAISTARKIYKNLPGSTLDLRIFNRPFAGTLWARASRARLPLAQKRPAGPKVLYSERYSDRSIALSCIAYLESGVCDIAPDRLKDVFALSSFDSLYLSDELLCDPWDRPPPWKFRRIMGNVGRHGMMFLIPPQSPMVRQSNSASWSAINNGPFNGAGENHFTHTSFKLSFTGCCLPINLGEQREKDTRAALLESVVSIYDAGRWVADVDVLRALGRKCLVRIGNAKPCSCHRGSLGRELISVECWDEILEFPPAGSVVRVRGSGMARLATAAVLAQLHETKGKRLLVRVCPQDGDFCFRCNGFGLEVQNAIFLH